MVRKSSAITGADALRSRTIGRVSGSEVIYPEGSPAQGLFAVLDGAVHFEKLDRAGHRVLLHVAPPGFWFGEIATGGGATTMVTARRYRHARERR